ncbi:MAG: 1-(5-phosphoribosyl)-5-[(5-phosphoribosylamino)methylideneamino]imidazole-4-carboxamide isomerase [Bacteroidia bacterium]|nr:1-(5-phosphoribosyl)-5-[(5-phosphoribosylamino)methylideneamino]imidazole-4-carboxamide isomerase [Bacteroidia bacterium]
MIDLIPAIDIINGECVRLTQGDFLRKKVYASDPLEIALRFEKAGVKRLHLVDLDGARSGSVKNLDVLRRLASGTGLKIDFSGGISDDSILKQVFDAGAAWAGIGSLAIRDPKKVKDWLLRFGKEKFLFGADVKNGRIAVKGWTEDTSLDVYSFIEMYMESGVLSFFCTDVTADGMMQGPSLDLYRSLLKRFPEMKLIASGGVRDLEDIRTLEEAGCTGVIIGKALYEGKISTGQLKREGNS